MGLAMTDLSDDELNLYARQILYPSWDVEAQLRLKNAQVGIIGMGGLGCSVAQLLVRSCLGRLHIVDHDTIDTSNLQRQTLYLIRDVGKPKALIGQQRLTQQNPLTQVTAHTHKLDETNIDALLDSACFDLIVDCSDNFVLRDLVNRACMYRSIPLLSSSAIGETGQLALYTKQTGCYRCVFEDIAGDTLNCATSGVLASTVAVIGALAAQTALDYLGRNHNPIAGELLLWQGISMTLRKLKFTKNPNCPICTATGA